MSIAAMSGTTRTTTNCSTRASVIRSPSIRAIIYGAEGKLELVRLGHLTGYISYSYMVGNVWFPVTGGLFLGDDADAALTQLTGHFPDSQDQRNTARTRFQYQLFPESGWPLAPPTDQVCPSSMKEPTNRRWTNTGHKWSIVSTSTAAELFRHSR